MPQHPTHPLLLAFSSLWALLSALWSDNGSGLEPNGSTGDNGSGLDPNG